MSTQNASLTPLPCPFCGVLPLVGPLNPKEEGGAWGVVECLNERCAVQPCCEDGEDCCDDRGSGAYKDAAIRRWNRRTGDASICCS